MTSSEPLPGECESSEPDSDVDPSTIELVARARAQPSDSFGELYTRVAPAVYAWASLHLGDALRPELDPEDVLQEVSCRAFRRFDTFDETRSSFRAWVFGIARNVLLGAMRRIGSPAQARRLDTDAGANILDPATSISRRVAREDLLATFLERIKDLPDLERRLIIHRGLEGLSHADVGRLLGLEPKAAAKRWDRLRARLRDEKGAPDIFVD